MPDVGIFFYVKGKVLADLVDIEHSELYGDFRIGSNSHYNVWHEKYYKIYKREYDYFPRGRIVYKYKEDEYILYADRCIDETGIKEILKTFDIEGHQVKVDRTDTHYVCKGCNKYYCD